ncbi:MAG TPA: DUF92 domain-containing protein [Gemmatimonadales bacterium]|nr:DUF92 domain-containing protein [Gemmatimonadales bacterium]
MGTADAALVAVAVAAAAWRAGALTRSGALAAAAIGTITLATGGWPSGMVLMAFFLPSSAISRLWPGPISPLDPKGDRRDAWQVLANGGAPVVALAIGGPGAALAFAAGLSAAAADTWGTATGAHSPVPPRHILTGRAVSPGTSGGVSLLGTAGAGIGAGLVAASALPILGWMGALAAVGIGLGGMVLDAALGAGVQGRFRCEQCQQDSERTVHRCGRPTRFLGGWAWMSNDWVNALATIAATGAGWVAGRGLSVLS